MLSSQRTNQSIGIFKSVLGSREGSISNIEVGQSVIIGLGGEFDIIAVAMQPSTGDWSKFMYCVSTWLRPDLKDSSRINKFQPVAMKPGDIWTDDFEECIRRLRSSEEKFNSVASDPPGLFN